MQGAPLLQLFLFLLELAVFGFFSQRELRRANGLGNAGQRRQLLHPMYLALIILGQIALMATNYYMFGPARGVEHHRHFVILFVPERLLVYGTVYYWFRQFAAQHVNIDPELSPNAESIKILFWQIMWILCALSLPLLLHAELRWPVSLSKLGNVARVLTEEFAYQFLMVSIVAAFGLRNVRVIVALSGAVAVIVTFYLVMVFILSALGPASSGEMTASSKSSWKYLFIAQNAVLLMLGLVSYYSLVPKRTVSNS